MVLADSLIHRNIDAIGVASAIVTIVGIVVTIIIYNRQKSPKTLDYAVEASQAIMASGSGHAGSRLQVIWTDNSDPSAHVLPTRPASSQQPLEPPSLLKARVLTKPRVANLYIRNTGKIPIDAADFQTPLTIEVGTGEIVDVYVTEVSNAGIYPLGSIANSDGSKRKQSFRPALLNSGDWIRVQVTTDQTDAEPKVSCWIKGQNRDMMKNNRLLDPPVTEVIGRRFQTLSKAIDPPTATAAVGTVIAAVVSILLPILNK
jgi:hypothetical protein